MSTLTLSKDQAAAMEALEVWTKDPDRAEMTLGGYAGTGKTTLTKEYVTYLRQEGLSVAVMALAGKAVDVLRRKGLYNAKTIHSSIYYADVDETTGRVSWRKKGKEEFIFDIGVVDESSMVSRELYEDLLSYSDMKFLWVGDHGQLEPIGDNPGLMINPEIRLEEIHRQAAENPIIAFAEGLRTDNIPNCRGPGTKLRLGPRNKGMVEKHAPDTEQYDQIICGFNSTRHAINQMVREKKGIDKKYLQRGDRLICLRNDKEWGIFNGGQGIVLQAVPMCRVPGKRTYACVIELPDGRILDGIDINCETLGRDLTLQEKMKRYGPTLWDYAYCITCHKSQGSEWDSVLVLEELTGSWDPKRWSYTAATRAAEHLTYLSNRLYAS